MISQYLASHLSKNNQKLLEPFMANIDTLIDEPSPTLRAVYHSRGFLASDTYLMVCTQKQCVDINQASQTTKVYQPDDVDFYQICRYFHFKDRYYTLIYSA